VGPEHSYLKDIGRVEYTSATDEEALTAFQTLSRLEGIIPALESSHAVAFLLRGPGAGGIGGGAAPTGGHGFASDDVVVLSLSGRGDKDVYSVADALGVRG
jgi:tryptophan synthase beta chain